MPLYPDIRPDWLKPESKSVLDPWWKTAVRGLVNVAGGDDPAGQVMGVGTTTVPAAGLSKSLLGLHRVMPRAKQIAAEVMPEMRELAKPMNPATEALVKQLDEFAGTPIKVPEGPPSPYGFGIPERPTINIPEGFMVPKKYRYQAGPTAAEAFGYSHGGGRVGRIPMGGVQTSPELEKARIVKNLFTREQQKVSNRMVAKHKDVPSVRGLEDLKDTPIKGSEAPRKAPMTSYERKALERKGVGGSLRTAKNPEPRSSKLDYEKVKEIHRLKETGIDPTKIAEQMGVAKDTILDVLRGRTWKSVK